MRAASSAASARPSPRRSGRWWSPDETNPLVPYLYLLPHAVFFLAFVVYPVLSGVSISVHRWDPLNPTQPFVGLEYYRQLFDPSTNQFSLFWRTLLNTLFFIAVSVPATVGLALLLATLLFRPVRGRAVFRAIFFMPGILSVTVMGILWKWMFENGVGLVNVMREQLFGLSAVSFLTTQWLAWIPIIVGTLWWTVGLNMTLYLAALGAIPRSLYEAAELDGASGWTQFWRITLPLLSPTTLFVAVTTVLGAFQLFGQSQLITGGGPTRTTQSVIMYITEEAFTNNAFSSAVAMSFVLGAVMMVFTGVQFRLMARDVETAGGTRRRGRSGLSFRWPAWLEARLRAYAHHRSMRTQAAHVRRTAQSGSRRRVPSAWPRFLLLSVLALLFLAPLYWMVSTSLKPESDTVAAPVQWFPLRPTVQNYRDVLTSPDGDLLRWALNSLIAALASTLVHLTICVLAAYALARLRFRGRDVWFWIVLGSMMVPGIVTLIPTYIMVLDLGWIDTFHALIWPGVAGAFGVFLLRQFFLGIPRELEEAARIDGASGLQVLWHVVLPLSVPALVTLAVFAFMGSWNNYIWPLFVVHGDMQTLPVGIAQFTSSYVTEYGKLMAGTTLAAVPVLIIYLFAQRFFEQGIASTGLKE